MGVLLKLRLLLWKNFLVRRRNKLRFVLEAVYPLFLFAVLVAQNPQGNRQHYNECRYLEKALPSAGKAPFLYSLLNQTVSDNACLTSNGTVQSGLKPALRFNQLESHRRSPRSLPHIREVASLPLECQHVQSVISDFSGNTMGRVIQPFITGKILYYPETAATREIMKQVNATFNMITSLPEKFPATEILELPSGMEILRQLTRIFGDATDVLSLNSLPSSGVDESMLPVSLIKGYETFRDNFEKCVDRDKVQAVTPETALNESWALINTTKLWGLVAFEGVEEKLEPLVKYKIRMSEDAVPSTRKVKTPFKNKERHSSPVADLQYITFGFAYLQDMIDSAVWSIQTGRKETTQPGRILNQFPAAAFTKDDLADLLSEVMPLMMVLAWIYTFSQTVKGIVVEKEERVKEVLAVMGVSRGVQSAGWVLEGIRSTFLTCVVLSLLLKYGGLMKNSDVTLLLVLIVSFVVAMLSFALFVSTFFSRPTLAGPCSGVIYFLTYYVYQLVRPTSGADPSTSAILGGCIVSNVALAEATLIVAGWEDSGEGAQWNNVFSTVGAGEPISLAGCIAMMWLDTLIYAVLAWYTENVFPGEFGVPKPFFFFLKKSFWLGTADEESKMFLESHQKDELDNTGNFEAEPQDSTVGVAIENLSKVFGKAKPAVNGLTLNFHEDQINCFLGHNGAGKTTTISMLTGMYPPSAGTARLFGRDIRTEMDAIRTSMGVCPQHNVLFGSLTVEEHLLFFGRIKGISEKVLKSEIDYMLAEMGLEDKRNARSNTLSGGMKRKLSVGIAFVGGSKVVFLDEPTAGVDPFSRRGIWELLLKFRQGRTIILTTHFMDEADLLGDRIAIMSEGQLQCCGSSVFLKERLGTGYHLTVEWNENSDQTVKNWKSVLTQEVLLKAPAARRVESDGPEESQAVFVLPERHDVATITALLEELERKRDALNIASYGVSDTSLEEIFLKVAKNKAKTDSGASDVVTLEDDESSALDLLQEPVTGWRLLVQQYVALTRKRFQYVRRDPRALFTQLALPAFFVTLALALSTSHTGSGPQPDLPLRTDMFGQPVVSFFEQLPNGSTWSDQCLKSMLTDGVGFTLAEGDAVQRSEMNNDGSTCSNSPPNSQNKPLAETLPSGELFYNATNADVEGWLLTSNSNCRRNRFGGASFGAQYSSTPSSMNQADNVKVWFSTEGYASVPTYLNAINNVLLRASLPAGADTRKYGIVASSWPLPADPVRQPKPQIDPVELGVVLSTAITVIFAMSFVPASFVMFLVEDRTVQTKHLQLVSGLRSYIYWLQSYTWDLVSFAASELLVIIIFLSFQLPSYTSGDSLVAVIFLIFTYGMSCTPLLYLFSWFFRIPTMAFLVLSTANLFIGLVTTITVMIMTMTAPDSVDYVQSVFLVFPQYCLGQGLINMATNYFQNQVNQLNGLDSTPSLSWGVTGKNIVAMLVMSAVLVCVVFLVEQSTHWWHGFMQNHSNVVENREDEEEDVVREGQRVDSGQADQGMLVVKRLTKRYGRKAAPAVAGVAFGVERGQCFGLLGLNGAGKTSIFKMLTGDTLISGGDALVSGHSVRADMDAVRRMTGYCPQFDALVSLLTVKEHLELYSSIHGIPSGQRPAAVRRAIQMFDLEPHKDKQAKSLSGGNKRKLSAAIALVGDPSLLYMDEPTTSMDPVARRFVWQRVRKVVAAGRSVLLTSHSMEECEALCDRLTIMVNGRLTCIGSPQHLKHKYGSGYMAVVRCPLDRVGEAQALVLQRLPGTVVKEAHLSQIKLQIPPQTSLVAIFRSLDDARRVGCLADYSVSQTTLEDVFMQFAEAQRIQSS